VNSTIVIGAASIALALLFRSRAHGLPADAVRLPSLLIWIVIGLAVLMIAEELLKRRKARQAAGASQSAEDEPLAPINWPVLGAFGAGALAYIALIPYAGYLVVTPVYLICGLWFSKTLSPAKAVAVGAVITAVIWGVFIWLLQLPIPLLPALN